MLKENTSNVKNRMYYTQIIRSIYGPFKNFNFSSFYVKICKLIIENLFYLTLYYQSFFLLQRSKKMSPILLKQKLYPAIVDNQTYHLYMLCRNMYMYIDGYKEFSIFTNGMNKTNVSY